LTEEYAYIKTPEELYVRGLLEDRRMIISNVQKARKIVFETDAEIIEGLSCQAADYSKVRVQSSTDGDTITGLLDRIKIERGQQRYDTKKLTAQLDADIDEVYWLDTEVFSLPAMLQNVVIARFYDRMTNAETETALYLGKDMAKKYVRKAIEKLGAIFADKRAKEAERNEMLEKEEIAHPSTPQSPGKSDNISM